MTAWRIVVEQGKPAGAGVVLVNGENLVGRSHSARVRVDAADVSGQHVRMIVAADAVTVENLSRYGTKLDNVPLEGVTPIKAGQRLTIGAGTVLRLEQVEEAAAAAGEPVAGPVATMAGATRVTGGAGGTIATRAIQAKGVVDELKTGEVPAGKPAGKPAPQADEAHTSLSTGGEKATGIAGSEQSRAAWSAAAGEAPDATGGETRAMQTRAAAVEEIEYLRQAERQRMRRLITMAVVVGIPLLALIIFFWPRTEPPETDIDWPKDDKGEYMDGFVSAPSGGKKVGGFDLAFPGTPGWKSTATPNGLKVETRIGRNLDVPMLLILSEDTESRYVEMDRKAALDEWMQQVSAQGGRWNFDAPVPISAIGPENGIPCLSVSYQRDGEGGSWFGRANLLRHGRRRIVLRVEVPAGARLRAEGMVATMYFDISSAMARSFWDGAPDIPKTEISDILRQVRPELERMAPATWNQLEQTLIGAIRKAARDGNKVLEDEALQMLIRLREQKSLWFNSQVIARFDANAQGDYKRSARISDFCKAVFSSPEDQRYYKVRKAKW